MALIRVVRNAGCWGVVLAALALACGSSRDPIAFEPAAQPEDAASDGGSFVSQADVTGPMGTACSGDLRQVLLGDGGVITCADDEGCLRGACVPACAAAGETKGSVGCDFLPATPSYYFPTGPNPSYTAPCFAAFLANNWPTPVKITIDRAGLSYDVTKFGRVPAPGVAPASWPAVPASGLPAGAVAVLFLSHANSGAACPIEPAISTGTQVWSSGRGEAWHIATNRPVTAYDILPFGGAPSLLPGASLLLPTTAWGTNYLAVVPPSGNGPHANDAGPHWAQVVALADDTLVDVVPTVALSGGTGVSMAAANIKTSYALHAGEYIQWQEPSPASGSTDFSGSVVSANKPVAFNGGSGYFCRISATSGNGGCDAEHEQIPPISAFASEYAIAPYTTRSGDGSPESIPYRIVGAAQGTTLTFDPGVAGAPASVELGDVKDFQVVGAFSVRSQDTAHPFYVAQIMTGNIVFPAGQSNGLGDEELVNVLPPAQFLSKYVFFTDPTYDTTNLVATRAKAAQGFADVNVDCIGNLTGWLPLGTQGRFEYTNVDLMRGGESRGNGCQNGAHSASSKAPFGLTVWGLSYAASYAYPAGGSVATINPVVVPAMPR